MNNAFKTTFNGKLSLSELLEKYDKCVARLRREEKYEDFQSRHTDLVLCIARHPLLKEAAASYTRSLYTYFEEEFQRQFTWSCTLLSNESTINTYIVKSFYRQSPSRRPRLATRGNQRRRPSSAYTAAPRSAVAGGPAARSRVAPKEGGGGAVSFPSPCQNPSPNPRSGRSRSTTAPPSPAPPPSSTPTALVPALAGSGTAAAP